jgi:chromosome segregation ATPase
MPEAAAAPVPRHSDAVAAALVDQDELVISAIRAAVAKLEGSGQALTAEQTAFRDSMALLEEKLQRHAQLQADVDALDKDNKLALKERKQAEEALEQMKQAAKEQNEEQAKAEATLKELTEKLEASKAQVVKNEEEKAGLVTKLAAAQATFNDAKASADAMAETIAALEIKIAELKERMEALTAQLANLQAEIAILQQKQNQAATTLQQQAQQHELLTVELDELKDKREDLDADYKENAEELTALRDSLKERKARITELEVLVQEAQLELAAANREVKECLDAIQVLEAAITALHTQQDQLDAELQKLTQEMAACKDEDNRWSFLVFSGGSKKDRSSERAAIQTRINANREKHAALGRQLDQKQQGVGKQNDSAFVARGTIDKANIKQQSNQLRLTAEVKERVLEEKEIDERTVESKRLKAALAANQLAVDNKRRAIRVNKMTAAQVQGELEALVEQQGKLTAEHKAAEVDVTAKQGELAGHKKQQKEVNARLETAREGLKVIRAQMDEVMAKLEVNAADQRRYQSELDTANNGVGVADETARNAKLRSESQAARVKELAEILALIRKKQNEKVRERENLEPLVKESFRKADALKQKLNDAPKPVFKEAANIAK